jgi:amino acid transporter
MLIAGIFLYQKTSKEDPYKTDRCKDTDRKVVEYLTNIGSVGIICIVLYITVSISEKYKDEDDITLYGLLFVFFCMFITGLILRKITFNEDTNKRDRNENKNRFAELLILIGFVFIIAFSYSMIKVKAQLHYYKR